MAVALEQEMRARVVEAEAEVPRAMAEAFRQGNLGIMDYYRMKNVQADTAMRGSIAETGEEPSGGQRRYRITYAGYPVRTTAHPHCVHFVSADQWAAAAHAAAFRKPNTQATTAPACASDVRKAAARSG